MKKAKVVSSLQRAGFLAAVLLCLSASVALGEVIPIDPDEFGPSAIVEDFEGIVGVELPIDHWTTIASIVPVPWDFSSGVSITGPVDDDSEAIVMDFQYDTQGIYGWGLSLEGGRIDATTELPSPTSMLAYYSDTDEPIVLTFDPPVTKVGFFGEASIWHLIGYDGLITLEAFNVDGVSLGMVETYADGAGINEVVDPPVDLGPVDTWIGLMATEPIGSVAAFGIALVMDNLTFQSDVVATENQTWGAVKSLYR